MAAPCPTYVELLWPTLKALRAMGGSATNAELLDKVIELEDYSEDVQNFLHSDHRQTKLNYNLAWAKTYLRIAGALENSARGVWAITEEGEQLTEVAVQDIPAEVRKLHAAKRKAEADTGDPQADDVDSVDGDWKNNLLDVLTKRVEPDAFERLCQRLLRESGFIKVEVTGRSHDGGIDGVGVLRLSLLSFQVSFQCKRYSGSSVSASQTRDFRGAMVGRSDKGLFITTGTFTSEAKKEATRDGAPAIDLIDGDHLCELLKKYGLGVGTEQVEQVHVDSDWFAHF